MRVPPHPSSLAVPNKNKCTCSPSLERLVWQRESRLTTATQCLREVLLRCKDPRTLVAVLCGPAASLLVGLVNWRSWGAVKHHIGHRTVYREELNGEEFRRVVKVTDRVGGPSGYKRSHTNTRLGHNRSRHLSCDLSPLGRQSPAMTPTAGDSNDEPRMIALPGGHHPIPLATLQSYYLPNAVRSRASWADEESPGLGVEPKLRVVVTGGAGFVGSHLVDRLMLQGHQVIVVDNFMTGRRENVQHWEGHPRFQLLEHDIEEALWIECDRIYHLACPASPPHYQRDSIKTVRTCVMGTLNMLELAKRADARFLLTSTSEVYGDPEVHPQPEGYRGCVNPIGVRACYDEGKRCSETLAYCYQRQYGIAVRVARIFNTYGPRMDPQDGRVVSNFITQALRNEPLTIYGDGKQTRSFQFVHDLVSGLMALMEGDFCEPVNLGNPEEYQIQEFAHLIRDILRSASEIVHVEEAPDDPQQRRPDISRAQKELGWSPSYKLRDGLVDTIEYFRQVLMQ